MKSKIVGRENVIAGADCGFAASTLRFNDTHPSVAWIFSLSPACLTRYYRIDTLYIQEEVNRGEGVDIVKAR